MLPMRPDSGEGSADEEDPHISEERALMQMTLGRRSALPQPRAAGEHADGALGGRNGGAHAESNGGGDAGDDSSGASRANDVDGGAACDASAADPPHCARDVDQYAEGGRLMSDGLSDGNLSEASDSEGSFLSMEVEEDPYTSTEQALLHGALAAGRDVCADHTHYDHTMDRNYQTMHGHFQAADPAGGAPSGASTGTAASTDNFAAIAALRRQSLAARRQPTLPEGSAMIVGRCLDQNLRLQRTCWAELIRLRAALHQNELVGAAIRAGASHEEIESGQMVGRRCRMRLVCPFFVFFRFLFQKPRGG